ncbi:MULTISPECIES: DUF3592 domain-containing protein [Saccharothrix]|uniref:DUF3592 domain-containing protein n=1 Tax=Saccharothrix TaxID=2071 RepID=UPI00093FE011|nr:DUF3592 domain-containing protein [Saccharothrix sp. CB00851]OKI32467.1 hypothetical protein A6A25_25425 [Saccharothrix sp. CB00851]
MERWEAVETKWLPRIVIVFGLTGVVVSAVGTVESFDYDVATAEVVRLETVDGATQTRARLRFTLPDGRVVTPLVNKHYASLQPGNRVEVLYDHDDPEATITYDRMNTGEWVWSLLVSVFMVVGAPFAVRRQIERRRDRR